MKWTDAIVQIVIAFDPKANPIYALIALALILAAIIVMAGFASKGGKSVTALASYLKSLL